MDYLGLVCTSFAVIVTGIFVRVFLSYKDLSKELKIKHSKLKSDREKFLKQIRDKEKLLKPSIDWTEIVLKSASELHEMAVNKTLSCLEILTAFQIQCAEYLEMNFLAEFIETADSIAEDFDNRHKELSHLPLYGVPVSLKESLQVANLDATCGLVKYCNNPKKMSCVIYQTLVANGAIPFITTSMARAGMSHDSSNPIFGEQHNPRYPGYTAGGSSGGEGIALSIDASPLGVGTDIGGSVRFPPCFNGICGINPCRRRISSMGVFAPGSIPRLEITLTVGPMARKVEDLVLFFQAVLSDKMFSLDPLLVPLPFQMNDYESEKPLRIAYLTSFRDNNLAQAVPSVQRAVNDAVNLLTRAGHQLKEFNFPRPNYGFRLVLLSLLHDSGLSLAELLAYEPIPAQKKLTMFLLNVPKIIRSKLVDIFYCKFGEPALPLRDAVKGISTAFHAAELIKNIEDYRAEFLKAMEDFDLILCPCFPVPIPAKNEDDTYNNISAIYAIMWNLLDLPAGVLCTSRVTEEDNRHAQIKARELEALGDRFNAHLNKTQTRTGLPLSVQVVARPFQEAKLLRVMKFLESNSQFNRYEVPIRKDHHTVG
ncbi:hypothetical protein Ciccas_009483 [Cichlidogyrus casuarinus]|uniref:Amidase domain-containing protein n=1 Tax=Cichlidogyrus casuarinus TaxID=1844966 RepID=A0ABD2PX43_9PLAT